MSLTRLLILTAAPIAVAALASSALAAGPADEMRALVAAPGVLEAILEPANGAAQEHSQPVKKLQEWERQLLAAQVWFDIDRERFDVDVVQTGSISDR